MTSEKTFLFFHGWGLSAYSYKKIIKELEKSGRVMTPKIDFLKYKDQLQFLSQKITGKAIVIGHSAGAIVAMEFVKNYPQKTEKVILLAPAGFTSTSLLDWASKWIVYIFKLIINPGSLTFNVLIDFIKTSLVHPIKRIKEFKKISKTDIPTVFGLKVLAIFGKEDNLIPLPKKQNNVKFEIVNGGHDFFIRNPKLLIDKI